MIRVIRHHASAGVLPLLVSEILLLFACFYVSAEMLYPPSAWFYLFLDGGITLVVLAIATIILAMYFFDMYADVQVSSRVLLMQQICQALGVAILAQTVATYIFRDWTVPQLLMLYSSVIALFGLFCWRLLFSALVKRIGPTDNLLFLGRNATSDAVAAAIERDPRAGYRVIGFLDDDTQREASGPQVLGGFASLRQMVAEYKPSLLVVGMPERRAAIPVADLVALRFEGLQIEEASKTYESVYQRVRLEDLSEQQVMFSRTFAPRGGAVNMARFVNTIVAALSLILLLPLLLPVALWLRLRGKGPVLAKFPREGKNGRVFQMRRFRQEPSLHWLYRRIRVDVMPELLNVLRGEMSLVGPSPEEPSAAKMLTEALPFYHYRNAVPPGITGWAQVNQTAENQDDRALALEYDLYYIKNLSQALNFYILMHSLKNRVLRP